MEKQTTPAQRIILGIDPGTSITGYGIIHCQGKHMKLITYGVIQLGKQQVPHPVKLKKIFDRVDGLIQEFQPSEMALEAPFHGKNIQAMLKLGRAQGIAMAAGLVNNLEIFEYAPRKVKMAVTGNGTASKLQICKTLESILDFKMAEKFLDATDGLSVAVCHFHQSRIAIAGAQKSHKDWSSFIAQNPRRIRKRR